MKSRIWLMNPHIGFTVLSFIEYEFELEFLVPATFLIVIFFAKA